MVSHKSKSVLIRQQERRQKKAAVLREFMARFESGMPLKVIAEKMGLAKKTAETFRVRAGLPVGRGADGFYGIRPEFYAALSGWPGHFGVTQVDILNILWTESPLSKADLAKALGCRKVAHGVLAGLVKSKLVLCYSEKVGVQNKTMLLLSPAARRGEFSEKEVARVLRNNKSVRRKRASVAAEGRARGQRKGR